MIVRTFSRMPRDERAAGHRFFGSSGTLLLLGVCFYFASPLLAQTYLNDIGWSQLKQELGPAMPNGAGIKAAQVEPRESSSGGYIPDRSQSFFSGKTFTLRSGASRISSHATKVGKRFYGNPGGVAPAIKKIDVWQLNSWTKGSLKAGSNVAPVVETARVVNHSWKGTAGDATQNQDALRRFDYQINRDNVVAVVALGNEGTTTVPTLLASSYNAIAVGISDGTSNHGLTTFDGAGRTKPDIVAPEITTSLACPLVSGSAALLLQTAGQKSALAAAQHEQVVKAILMAGATKNQFPNWNRTTTHPLDETFGAGQVNIDRSFYILSDGDFKPGRTIGSSGWDFNRTTAAGLTYDFVVPQGSMLAETSLVLTWNRAVADGPAAGFGNLTSSLANLDMTLSLVQGTTSKLIDASRSTVDNVEELFDKHLGPGRYRLKVTSNQSNVPFGLAWYENLTAGAALPSAAAAMAVAVPEPSSVVLLGLGLLAGLPLARRRRRVTRR